jgi:hypothetical protein
MALSIADFPLCCGAYVLNGFSSNTTKKEFEKTLAEIPQKRAVFAILNKNQIEELRDTVVVWLAESGFVLTDSWINGVHESLLFSFVRIDNRRRLDSLGTDWWKGAVQRTNLEGTLKPFSLPVEYKVYTELNRNYAEKRNPDFRGYENIDTSLPLELEDGTPVTLVPDSDVSVYIRVTRTPPQNPFEVLPPIEAGVSVEGRRNPFDSPFVPPGTFFLFLRKDGRFVGQELERMAVRNVGMQTRRPDGTLYTPLKDEWPPEEPVTQPWGQRYNEWPTF